MMNWRRASGMTLCPLCQKEYHRHPFDIKHLDSLNEPWLRKLCNGDLVKT